MGVAVGTLVVNLVLSSEGALEEAFEDQSVAHKWCCDCVCLFKFGMILLYVFGID